MKNKYWLILGFLSLVLQVRAASTGEEERYVPRSIEATWDIVPKKLYVTWTSTDYHIDKFSFGKLGESIKMQPLVGWRGERLHAKLLVGSPSDEEELSFSISEPTGVHWVDKATTGFMRYVMTDELAKDGKGGCGYRPNKAEFDSLLVADRIEPIETIAYEPRTVRPIWITFDVPHDAKPGVYKGAVQVRSRKSASQLFHYSIRVLDKSLPHTSERKFHLDLWQNPFSIARLAGTPLWSEQHFEVMRPLMERLGRAGQRGITAFITHKPWNAQTYDYYENLISEIRLVDGSWRYDYTLFDRWVEFMKSCGVYPYIYCYSVIPWELTFRYYDQATNSMVDRKLSVDDPEFDDYWVSKLQAFARHLKSKGWFDHTVIAMDERPKESMQAALRVIRKADPLFKISLAGIYHEELDQEIFDYCISYDDIYPNGVIEARKQQGKITTFYTYCNQSFPNTFTFSQPIEAAAYGPVAEERGLDGYLRWAYNSWVEAPSQDSRFHTWAAGDTYLVYPQNNSSARFEKLVEGIQLFEKIQILKESPGEAIKIQRLLAPFAYGHLQNVTTLQKAMKNIRNYLNSK